MSILIKGMKMPKTCVDCDAYIAHDYCTHFAQFATSPRKDGRYDDCPLVEIPTPHGRLIDASELIKSYMRGTKTDIDDFYDTIDIIDNAPTILEAEEK